MNAEQQQQVGAVCSTKATRRWPSLLALGLSALLGLSGLGLSPLAEAQSSKSTPKIAEFYVETDDELTVGSKLEFTLEGSERGIATVRISGIAARIPLREVEPGVYEGSYTVKPGDRITTASTARGTLKRRNRSTSMMLQESLGVTVNSLPPLPVPALPGVLAIEILTVTPIDRLEAGADLDFTMLASPGGQASVTIEGVANPVPLRETKSGQYSGSYTLRRNDRIAANARVSGTLEVSGRTLRTLLNQPLVASVKRPVIGNLSPAQGEKLSVGESVSVSGTFDETTGGGIDPRSVVVTLDGQDVSRNAVITPQFFNYRSDLEPGSHTAVVTAKDRSGASLRQSWQFSVAAGSVATSLQLEITSHQNMAQVLPGLTEVRGRTAADASVDIQVLSVSAIFGMFGYNQNLLSQTVRADARGNFMFSFVAPPTTRGGGRVEISLTATKGNLRQTQSLVLMQAQ